MAKKVISRSPGSLILEIIVVVLIIVLILAILTPKKQWANQVQEEALCRQKMENIYFASKFYHRFTHSYTDNIKEILAFAERESIRVHPPGFKLDRLTREESGIDSFQVDYYDPYGLFSHYERDIQFRYIDAAKKDSVILEITPKEQYPFAPVTRYYFAADLPITVMTDDRGDQGSFTMVGAQGKLRGTQELGEQLSVIAAQYIYNIDTENMDKCTGTGTPYDLQINVKLGIVAEMMATIKDDPSDNNLASSHLFSSIVVYQMLKKADGMAKRTLLTAKTFDVIEDSLINEGNQVFLDSIANTLRSEGLKALASAIYDSTLDETALDDAQTAQWEEIRDLGYNYMNRLKEDSTLQANRDNIINEHNRILIAENFRIHLDKILSDASVRVVESGFIITSADSIDYYSDSNLIKKRLLKAREDAITKSRFQS